MIKAELRTKIEELLMAWPQSHVLRHLELHLPGYTMPSQRTISRIAAELKASGKPYRRPTKPEKLRAARERFKPAKAALERAAAAYREGQTPPPGAKRATYAAIAREYRVKIATLVRWCRKLRCRKKDVTTEWARPAAADGGPV